MLYLLLGAALLFVLLVFVPPVRTYVLGKLGFSVTTVTVINTDLDKVKNAVERKTPPKT